MRGTRGAENMMLRSAAMDGPSATVPILHGHHCHPLPAEQPPAHTRFLKLLL